MSSSRLVSILAVTVIVFGVLFVAFVIFAGRNRPQPGSEPPPAYEPPPEFIEQVRRQREAWEGRKAEPVMGNSQPSVEDEPPPPSQPPAEEAEQDAVAPAPTDAD